MLKAAHKYRWWAFGIVCAAFVVWLVLSSPSFQSCINEGQDGASGNQFQKIYAHLLFFRGCLGCFLVANESAISAYSTVIIALFTAILGIFTVSVAKSTRISAEATREIAKATTAIEYPIILSSYIGPPLDSTEELIRPNHPYACVAVESWPTKFSAISYITFQNYGRTPAFPRSIQVGIAVIKSLPFIPVYTHTFPCTSGPIIEEKSSKALELHFGFELSDSQLVAIKESSAFLWFYAALAYHDVRGQTHEARVCWQWGRQNPADGFSYFFDDGSAPVAYTRAT